MTTKSNTTETKKTTLFKESPDGICVLRSDYKAVKELADDYEKSISVQAKQKIATKLGEKLSVHAQVEEEIFYPAAKQKLNEQEMIYEAFVELGMLRTLISEAEGMKAEGEMLEAKIKVMSEYTGHCVKEEEKEEEVFPEVKKNKPRHVKAWNSVP